MSIPDKDYVYEALVCKNFLPNQKRDHEEMPPVFSTEMLSGEVRKRLMQFNIRSRNGYDQIDYKLTRFNNVPRLLSIPHLIPYINLSKCIAENWEYFFHICKNDRSRIIPRKHDDGRIIIMDYEKSFASTKRIAQESFGKKFKVKTDIANCFPSIYSHSIPRALVGIKKSKQTIEDDTYYNNLDKAQMHLKRNETSGLPIGPATSNIITELILYKIDKKLEQEGFVFFGEGTFSRFIDDYTGYFETRKAADKFISLLSEQLSKYKLQLNIRKTEICELPTSISPNWLLDISTRLSDIEKNSKNISYLEAVRFMDYALSQQDKTPDGSVLKFMAKSLIPRITPTNTFLIFLFDIAFYYPILLPLFETKLETLKYITPYEEEIKKILNENITKRRSDGIAWSLYYLYCGFKLLVQQHY
jgi:hypothetical protein